MHRSIRLSVILTVASLVAGCGGGSGGVRPDAAGGGQVVSAAAAQRFGRLRPPSFTKHHAIDRDIAILARADALRMSDDRFFAVIDGEVYSERYLAGCVDNLCFHVSDEHGRLPTTELSQFVRQRNLDRGSAVDLLDYLKDQASGGPWGPEGQTWSRTPKMPLWTRRPTVRVESSAAPELHRMTAKAVDLINDWLPLEHRMVMGAPTALRTDNSGDVPTGGIHMNFRFPGDGGAQHYHPIRDDSDPNDVPTLRTSVVRINPNSTWHQTYGLIVHELVHALGVPGHVSEDRHPTTIMPDGEFQGGPLPDEAGLPEFPRLDGEALMTAYTVFDDGHTPDEINSTSLGPWASTIPAVNGEVRTDGGTASFGVEYRTQWTRAWDEGPVPATTLAASTLTGTATWTGALVGYTDAGAAVEGDAGISVTIETMAGTAAFTDLMAGDSSWGPDLSTDIGVTGNYFAATGSEPRLDVQGQFRGSGHEAATGVLRWEDIATGNLTGAFGAVLE